MKIVMTSEVFLPRLGGGEMHVWYLINRLRERGHTVTLLTNESDVVGISGKSKAFPEPPQVTRILWKRKHVLAMFQWLWRESADADVIHSHFSYRLAVLAGIVGRIRGIPIVVTLHGLGTLDEAGARFVYRIAHSVYRYLSLTLATKIISTSEDLAVVAWRHAPSAERKTEILFNGIDATLFHENILVPNEIEDQFKDKKVVMTVRRLVPKNGVHFLVESFPRILKKVPDAVLVMLGGGRLKGHIEKRVAELGITSRVYLVGDVENERVPGFVSRADVVVFPSTAESTSIACAEAMAMGKSIVSSRVGGLIELLGKNEERGRLVRLVEWESSNYDAPLELPSDRYDALAGAVVDALTKDDSKRRLRARDFAVHNLDWDVVTDRTLQFYGK